MRNKRRKIQKKKEVVYEEFNIDIFRKEVVNLVNYWDWEHAMTDIHTKKDEGFFSGISSYWVSEAKKKAEKMKYDGMSSKQRTKKILEIDLGRDRLFNMIQSKNRYVNMVKINIVPNRYQFESVYSKYFPIDGMGKDVLVSAIVQKFFDDEIDEAKRTMEQEYMGDSCSFISMTLCGIDIPRDLIGEIFSYLVHDSELLYNLGSVCKEIYLMLLSTWPRVLITRKNIYKISLLVLKNVKEVFICEKLLKKDMAHLMKNIGHHRLRVLSFRSKTNTNEESTIDQVTIRGVFDFFKNVEDYIKKNDNPFQNVQRLYLPSSKYTNKPAELKKFRYRDTRMEQFRISKLFPRLEELNEPMALLTLNKCSSVRKLALTMVNFDHYGYESSGKHLYPTRDFVYVPTTLHELTVKSCHLNHHYVKSICLEPLSKLISKQEKLRKLSIQTSRSLNGEFDFASLGILPKSLNELFMESLNNFNLRRSNCVFHHPTNLENLRVLTILQFPFEEFSALIKFKNSPSLENVKFDVGITLQNETVSDHFIPVIEQLRNYLEFGDLKEFHLRLFNVNRRWNIYEQSISVNYLKKKNILNVRRIDVQQREAENAGIWNLLNTVTGRKTEYTKNPPDTVTMSMLKNFLELYGGKMATLVDGMMFSNTGEFGDLNLLDEVAKYVEKDVLFDLDEKEETINSKESEWGNSGWGNSTFCFEKITISCINKKVKTV